MNGRRLAIPVVLAALGCAATLAQKPPPAMPDERTREAVALMTAFAERTGLTGDSPPERYLWTDAFAVCNFLGLARATGDDRYLELALALVDQVHATLGRHRPDDRRTGWISGLSEEEGRLHPTRGGLRIGKPLPERARDEPFDDRLEWDRDGQYFHYLTKWMHALDQVARATGEARFNDASRELAAASRAFTYTTTGGRARMYWKMSIDLSRPLVPSMGQHDPLDGYLTLVQLGATAARLGRADLGPDLVADTRALKSMIAADGLATTDPLGIGGLLTDAFRADQLARSGMIEGEALLGELLSSARAGLDRFARADSLRLPAEARLAFRELGLAIGLEAVALMREEAAKATGRFPSDSRLRSDLAALSRYDPLRETIESFWRQPAARRTTTWSEHRDINEVMLATSLAPEGFLVLLEPPPGAGRPASSP